MAQLISLHGGAIFNQGIYRLHTWGEIDLWSKRVGQAFPEFNGKVVVFGEDWQGNQFGWQNRISQKVLLFQIASGEAFEVADSIASFHNEELVEHSEGALNESLWRGWVRSDPEPLPEAQGPHSDYSGTPKIPADCTLRRNLMLTEML